MELKEFSLPESLSWLTAEGPHTGELSNKRFLFTDEGGKRNFEDSSDTIS